MKVLVTMRNEPNIVRLRWYGCTLSKLFRLGDGGRMAHSMLHSTGACRCQIYSVVSRQHRYVMATSHAIHRDPDDYIYTVVVVDLVIFNVLYKYK